MNARLTWHKLTHWEYWPFELVYVPIYFQWAWYALRARSPFFFNAANPSILNGGFFNESKYDIYRLIPPQYYPTTILVRSGEPIADVLLRMHECGIQYPFIAKPDIGLRGSGVKKIVDADALPSYHTAADFDYLIQNLIPYQEEVGIFYVKLPGQTKGRVTGIVRKEFVKLTGDGKSNLAQLLEHDPRYAMQLPALRREHGARLEQVLPEGQTLNLVPYGNHARGAKFLDHSNRVTPRLEATIEAVCSQVPDFHFGRLDIMFDDFAALENGTGFQIVELNGAASEPTHIYDPSHSLFFAWKELARHINYMFKISRANHQKGARYLAFGEGMAQWKKHREQSAKINRF